MAIMSNPRASNFDLNVRATNFTLLIEGILKMQFVGVFYTCVGVKSI